jgi:hypothetical protein
VKVDLGFSSTKRASALMILLVVSVIAGIAVLPRMVRAADTATVRAISEATQIGPGNAIGQEFDTAIVIENITNLFGESVKMHINTTYFDYVSHVTMVPWNDSQTPIPPSPYAGILYSPYSPVKDSYTPSTSILEVAYSSMNPAPSFNGTGALCIVTLRVKYQQFGSGYVNVTAIEFTEIKFATKDLPPQPIDYVKEDFIIKVYGRPQPPGPTVEVEDFTYKGSNLPHELNLNVSILDLDEYWDFTGFDIKLSFDPNTIQVENATLGDFAQYYNLTWKLQSLIDNDTGLIWAAYMFDPTKGRTIPEGDGTLIVLQILANCSSKIKITESKLAAWPHPERSEDPWLNQPYSIAVPHNATDGNAGIIGIKSYTVIDALSVTTESDYCIGLSEFDGNIGILRFDVYVSPGEEGYANITIPVALMFPPSLYRVFVNGQSVDFTLTEAGNNAYVYVAYDDTAVTLMIVSRSVVPEFPIPLVLLLAFLATALLAAKLRIKRKY